MDNFKMQNTIKNNSYETVDANNSENYMSAIDLELNRLFPTRNIKRVLFVVPPDGDAQMFNYETAKRGRYYNYPEYGFGIIAAYLLRDGIEVRIINLNNEILKACISSPSAESFDFDSIWKSRVKNEIDAFNPDIIGLTCMFTQASASTSLVCAEIKCNYSNIPLALGGVHITNCFMNSNELQNILSDFNIVDLFFLFESEISFRYFVQVVNRMFSEAGLSNLVFNTAAPRLFFSKREIPAEKDLDIIPAYELMCVKEVSKYGVIGSFACLKEANARSATVIANRGCRGRCTYCSVRSFNGVGVRCRSVQSIIDELLLLRDKFGIDHIMWLDDDLLYEHKRAINLFNEMVRQNVGITWDCTNGIIATSCREEVMAAAAESGCIGVNIGVESGNPVMLRKIKKPGGINNFISAANVLRKFASINSRVFLMIGFPGETYKMIMDTMNLAMEMDLDWNNITIFQPLPNTPIFNEMV
ncbi:MAG: B12-binding domain-containing radical SAM protein, partial [Candidatus Omnitrophica bacterium]|nr:B12-binding domain-containing radical SAM protein [Candidatus Omnitrophota bacterium]